MPATRRKAEISLFHPKKKPQQAHSPPKPPTPRPTPTVAAEDDDDGVKLPEGPFQEFKIISSPQNGWKYNVMKFHSRDPVDVSTWQQPVKLNRKDPRRHDTGQATQEAVAPMLGLDGKPVIGADGRMVMVDAQGRPIHNAESSSQGGKDGKDKGAAAKKKFQKKTRQVFIVPDAVRQLRREEKFPWVIEDATGGETWTGQMEEASKSETHGFFMPTSEDKFQFVSAHRWYKFQKKQNHAQLSAEEVEKLMEQQKKNRDPEFWLMRRRNGQAPSAATTAIFKAEAEGRVLTGGSGSLVHTSGQSLGPGGRKLKAVDKDSSGLFGDDDEEGGRRKKEDDGEGDMDEMLFDEEFADDDEGEAPDEDDEDAKELEERLKKEYKSANKQRDGHVDESEDEDDGEPTKENKKMKKLIRNLEKNNAYESDEDSNPYASSEEEEEEEEPPATTNEPAIQPQPPSQPPSRSQTPARPSVPSGAASRATSPAAPGLGGHSIVAKRATSPKPPRPGLNGARSTSPLASGATHANGSRASSPAADASGQKTSKKRKATDEPNGTVPSPGSTASAKKRKPMTASDSPPVEAKTVIEWLKNTPGATTKDCIKQFTKFLQDKAKREQFTAMMKQLAVVKDGVLMLRPTT